MNRYATVCQRRQRTPWRRSRPRRRENIESERERFKEWVFGRSREQTGVDGTTTKSSLEGLADNDLHRLVRVTAFRLLVYLRPPGR